jgi:hypothetical protein
MKIREIFILSVFCLLSSDGLSQALNKFIGISLSYNHDDLANNRLLSNYFPIAKSNADVLDVSGEFVISKSVNKAIGFDLGYHLNQSLQERLGSATQAPDYSKSSISGIEFGPKYRIMRGISNKISFYSDFKIQVHYLMHRNTVTNSDPVTYLSQRMKMNGNEFKYGVKIVPGLVFYPINRIGIKIENTMFEFYHSTIKESKNTDLKFKPISSWDYDFLMKLSELKIGLIFKI